MAILVSPEIRTQNDAVIGIAELDSMVILPNTLSENAIVSSVSGNEITVAHDGDLRHMDRFAWGYDLDKEQSDNQIITAAIDKKLSLGRSFPKSILEVLPKLKGAFSLMVQHEEELIFANDRYGESSMYVGTLDSGGFVVSSLHRAVEQLAPNDITQLPSGTFAHLDAANINVARWCWPTS